MKIAFDAKRAFCNSSGLGTYSRNLINALIEYFPQDAYHLFTPYKKLDFQNRFILHQPKTKLKLLQDVWRVYGCSKDINTLNPAVYHGLSNELPFSAKKIKAKKVVTIHDVIFKKYTDQYSFIDRKIYDKKTAFACQAADVIIACSHETKNDLIQYYRVPSEKIEVVYQSCHPAFFEKPTDEKTVEIYTKYQIEKPYILHIGSFNERKNQLGLLFAYSKIYHKINENLLLVGSDGNMKDRIKYEISKLKLEKRVKIIEGVSNEQLPVLYRGASLFVFPSFYEGFGIPLIEAMASKTPIACSREGCIEEICRDAAFYFSPNDSVEMADKILRILSDKSAQNLLIKNGSARMENFSPEKFATAMHAIYHT